MDHVVALSGGKDSTAMALRLRELNPKVPYYFVCTPTGNELPEMLDHWNNLATLLDTKLTIVSSGHSLGSLITKWNALPNWRQRWCTRVLKIEPFQAWLLDHLPATTYVGIRADEAGDREGAHFEGNITHSFPLVEWGWGLRQVTEYLAERGVTIPARTDCGACFYQTLHEWWSLWKVHPERYAQAEAWEVKTGHTFRSPSRDQWPTSLANLRWGFEHGLEPPVRTMKDRPIMCSTCAR